MTQAQAGVPPERGRPELEANARVTRRPPPIGGPHILWLLYQLAIAAGACSSDSGTEESESISPPAMPCVQQYSCSEWSVCVKGTQTRSCNVSNACTAEEPRPAESQACEEVPPPTPPAVVPPAITPADVGFTLGPIEVVVDWEKEHCEIADLPDVYPHAIRNHLGEIVLQSGGPPQNYFSFGNSFETLKRNCKGVLKSVNHPNIEAFKPMQWITGIYSEDGQTVHALVHNEYHDPYTAKCTENLLPSDYTTPANPCWYNFITYAVSNDGGHTFAQPDSPNHLVAPFPYRWSPTPVSPEWTLPIPPAYGYMEPSNIVKHKTDGHSYAVFRRNNIHNGGSGTCIMRTKTLGDPASWRAWDGTGFNLAFINPYGPSGQPSNPNDYLCAWISKPEIGEIHGGLSYNTYLERYLMTGSEVLPDETGKLRCGIWFTLSDDLIHWEKPKLLVEHSAGFPPCDAHPELPGAGYPSIIDPSDTTPGFENSGQSPYLFYARDGYKDGLHGPYNLELGGAWDTDIVRQRITFKKKE